MQRFAFALNCLGLIALSTTARTEDWKQFRGPNASGLSTETQLPNSWAFDQNVRWSTKIAGAGWSSPIVVGGKVFITTAVPDGRSTRDTVHRFEIHCYDASTGTELWKQVALQDKPRLGKHRDNTYASETPVSDGENIIAYFGMMGVFCYDLNGNLKWKKDLGNYPVRNDWGTSSSPTIHKGKVFFQIDNERDSFMVALDGQTGNELWRKPREEKSNWGSVVLWENLSRTELITGGDVIRSYDPGSGELNWSFEMDGGGANSTPAATDSILIVGRGGRGGSSVYAVKPGASGTITDESDAIAWTNEEVGPSRSSPLIYQGFVYLLGGRNGEITCLDVATGRALYERQRLPNGGQFWASPYAYNGLIFCPDADGKTFVIKPGPVLEVVATNILPDDESTRYWASSAIANGTVFIRSSNTLYAVGR